MIDIESFVYAPISIKLKEKYGKDEKGKYKIFVSGEYTASPAFFPAVTIVEIDNAVYQKMRTTKIENAETITYEVNVYSNLVSYAKQEAKELIAVIDEEFTKLGFTRTMCNPIQNLADSTIYRMVARYEGVADKNYMIFTH